MGTSNDMDEALSLKEQGNESFKNGDYNNAISLYTQAIKLDSSDTDLAVFLKNRAAAYLKVEKYEEALEDCNKSMSILTVDPKTLFRRLQAFEKLERYEEAYRDARELLKIDPTNTAIQPILERLHKIVQERANQNANLTNRVESMNKYAFDITSAKDKRETAINNLLVLAREKVGAELIIKNGVLMKIKQLLKVEKNQDIYLSAIRLVGVLCKNSIENTKAALKELGLPWFLEIIDSKHETQVNATQTCMQTILNSFSGMDNKPDTKPDKELCEKYKFQIDTLLSSLVYSINNNSISGIARDAIIELLMRNIHYTTLVWADRMVEIGGVGRLLECASELEECRYESSMDITSSTTTIASVCLARIYENMYYDKAKEKFLEKIDEFLRAKLLSPDIESKIRVTVAITALLKGPIDVGNTVIAKEGK